MASRREPGPSPGARGGHGAEAAGRRLHRRSWEVRAQTSVDALRAMAREAALARCADAAASAAAGGRPEPARRRWWWRRLADWWQRGSRCCCGLTDSWRAVGHDDAFCERYRHVVAQLCTAECYLRRRATPWSWWRGTRIEGAWAHIHRANVGMVHVATTEQLFALSPRLLGVIDGYLKDADPERRAVQSWFDSLPRVAAPSPFTTTTPAVAPASAAGAAARVPAVTAHTSAPATTPPVAPATPGGVTDEARGALASALATSYDRIAGEYQRLRRFEWMIIGSATLILLLLGTLGYLASQHPEVVPLCFPDPDEAPATTTTTTTGTTATTTVETTTTAGTPATTERAPVCPSRDRPAPDAGGAEAASDEESPYTGGDVWTVLLYGLVGAAFTSVPFVVRRAPPTSVPISGIRVAQAALKAAMGMLSAVVGLLFLRAGIVPGFTEIDSRSQVLTYALIFGAAQELVTRFIDARSNTLVQAVTADDAEAQAGSRSA